MGTLKQYDNSNLTPTTMSYELTCHNLTTFLINSTLINSYFSFQKYDRPYPFSAQKSVMPSGTQSYYEHSLQRPALVIIANSKLPNNLRKHIRFRSNNKLTIKNLQRYASDIAIDHELLIKPSIDHANFTSLLDSVLEIDYALLMQRLNDEDIVSLSHIHVKVERLTDNAVRSLARDLSYIKRSLYEKGEAYADKLEQKFYEYFGFPSNASGRKCAAAMAAQLLSQENLEFTVFASCQEDCHLTVLNQSDVITKYMLIKIDLGSIGITNINDFAIQQPTSTTAIVTCCMRFKRTAFALPLKQQPNGTSRIVSDDPWLTLVSTELIPLPNTKAIPIPFEH